MKTKHIYLPLRVEDGVVFTERYNSVDFGQHISKNATIFWDWEDI